MIKNAEILEQSEREHDRDHPLTLYQKYMLLDSLYELGRQFGHFTPGRVMDGIGKNIALARKLNANLSNPSR